MAKYCIIGNGLIANALKKKVKEYSFYPASDTKYVFYLGGTTHKEFEKNPFYFFSKETDEIYRLMHLQKTQKFKLFYPSSALVYEHNTQFTDMKTMLEKRVLDTGGIVFRIFPVYGTEEKKTVISQWCRQMMKGEQPVIYGDGTQTRNFIYVDDVADQMLKLADKPSGIYDIGSSEVVSFNAIVYLINQSLGTNITPIYTDKSQGYAQTGVVCQNPLPTKVTLAEGINKICNYIYDNE